MEISNYENAYSLHVQILADANNAADSLIGMCEKLKRMRDEKLFLQLGCETFGAYCESMVGIKERQAYTYISTLERLGISFLRENQRFGITRLELISQLPPVEVAEKIEELEGMTAAEIRDLVRKNRELSEQLAMFEESEDTCEDQAEQPDENEAEQLRSELHNLQERMEEELAEKEAEFAREKSELEAKYKERESIAVETAKKDAVMNAERERKEAVRRAVESKTAEANEKISSLIAEKTEALRRAAEADKKASVSDDRSVRARLYFDQMADYLEKVMEEILHMDDLQQARFYNAVRRALVSAIDRIDDETAGYSDDLPELESDICEDGQEITQ